MQLTLLGTGTPAPSLTRQGSSYLVRAGSDILLFDHGQGAGHRLLEAGLRPSDVTHLFLTHMHYDHIADVPRLLLQHWDHGGADAPALHVYGPAPVPRIIDGMIGEAGVFALDIAARTTHPASLDVYASRGGTPPRPGPAPVVTEIAAGDVIEGDGWRVVTGQARHFQPVMDCLAYRTEADGRAIVYSGDSGGVLDSMVALATGCDVLIHMCHFLSGTEPNEAFRLSCGGHRDVAEIARRAGAGTLVLTHFPPSLDRPGVAERMVAEIGTIFDGTVMIGRDLMDVPFGTSLPKGIE